MTAQKRVTPEAVVEAILQEMQDGIFPGYYKDFVRNIFRVYVEPREFERLRPLLPRIRDEAIRALDEELQALNRGRSRRFVLPFQAGRTAEGKRYEALGGWVVEFHPNTDEDAAGQGLIVIADAPPDAEADALEGTPTVRVASSPAEDSAAQTRRSAGVSTGAPGKNAAYARLTYEDERGRQTFEMTKDLIKAGRGGVHEWVDLKLYAPKDISREHFQVRRDAASGRFFIKDLSRFGTWVNGTRVPPSITLVNGLEQDQNIETPLPSKAAINLADVLLLEFKVLRSR